MIRSLSIGATAFVLLGSSLASAQTVPGSDAAIRAHDVAERAQVAVGYPDTALRSNARTTTFGYPASAQSRSTIPGSEATRRQAEENARASVQRGLGANTPGADFDAF